MGISEPAVLDGQIGHRFCGVVHRIEAFADDAR